jgi:serine/threonine protein kinase
MNVTDDNQIGQLAVGHAFITQPELDRCVEIKANGDNRPLAEIMVAEGFITDDQRRHLESLASGTYASQVRLTGQSGSTSGATIPISDDGGGGNVAEAIPVNPGDLGPTQTAAPTRPPAGGGMPPTQDFFIGRNIGQIKIVSKLGQGGMGVVYRGHHNILEKDMAVKVLPENLVKNKSFVDRFYREAKTAAKLDHPNIVRVIDVGNQEGHYFIVMEFVTGDNLSATVRRDGPMSPEQTLEVMLGTASALEAAHAEMIIHRDIKPANIMITTDGKLKIMDFGLAKATGDTDGEKSDKELTMAGQVLGSPHFMSPEQGKGESGVDIRADMYSLGASAYFLSTGKYPYDAETPLSVILKHSTEKLVPPRRRVEEIPEAVGDFPRQLDEVICWCMEKDVKRRPQTPTELVKVLQKIDLQSSASARDLIKSRGELAGAPPQVRTQEAVTAGSVGRVSTDVIVEEIRKKLKAKHLGAARNLVTKALENHPADAALLTLRKEVDGLYDEIDKLIDKSREMEQSGLFADAAKEVRKILDFESEHRLAVDLIDKVQRKEKELNRQLALIGEAKKRGQLRAAVKAAQSALALDRNNETAKKHVAELKPRLLEMQKLAQTGQQAYEAGDREEAIRVWTAALSEYSPEDRDLRKRVETAEDELDLIDELEEAVSGAIADKDYQAAIDSGNRLLRLLRTPENEAKLAQAREALAKQKRARAIRNTVITVVVLLALVAGAVAVMAVLGLNDLEKAKLQLAGARDKPAAAAKSDYERAATMLAGVEGRCRRHSRPCAEPAGVEEAGGAHDRGQPRAGCVQSRRLDDRAGGAGRAEAARADGRESRSAGLTGGAANWPAMTTTRRWRR